MKLMAKIPVSYNQNSQRINTVSKPRAFGLTTNPMCTLSNFKPFLDSSDEELLFKNFAQQLKNGLEFVRRTIIYGKLWEFTCKTDKNFLVTLCNGRFVNNPNNKINIKNISSMSIKNPLKYNSTGMGDIELTSLETKKYFDQVVEMLALSKDLPGYLIAIDKTRYVNNIQDDMPYFIN